ncbi:hypothetical protein AX15_001978 [Amanita polypyramis BW_CC]|nr:hypothetical protein AX15_001978 [Amanita polypyramis BW_CC]
MSVHHPQHFQWSSKPEPLRPSAAPSPLRHSTSAIAIPTAVGSSPPPPARSSSFFSFKKTHSNSLSDTTTLQPAPSPPLKPQYPQHQAMSPPPQPANGHDIRAKYDQPLPSPPSPQPQEQHPESQSQPQVSLVSPVRQQSTGGAQQSQLHPEIRSLVHLNTAHGYKVYYSGPLVRKIERLPDGQRPAKDEGWVDIWAQLGGTTLSIWDMKQVQEASKQGREVPPTYINTTDAFVRVLGALTVPGTPTTPAKRYTDILDVNTAGSNSILFSCPSREVLLAWVAALRLASWEKSRLEEIYTAHLIRVTQQARDIPSTLVRGKMEGWVRIRISGQTDWKRLWMVVCAGADRERPTSAGGLDISQGIPKRRRMSSLFSRDHSSSLASPTRPLIALYLSQKSKDRKKALLTMQNVTQAFAVYPERPELISKSTLIKVEGLFADEELAKEMRNREGWIMVLPDLEGGQNQVGEMLKWIIALHDAFGLYGRPYGWTWDPRERASMMFGYPVGPQKETLFLDREAAETLDPRHDRTSAVRSNLQKLLFHKMQNTGVRTVSPERQQQLPEQSNPNAIFGPQLPPLSFADIGLHRSPLTPVAEGSTPDIRIMSVDAQSSTVVPPPAETMSASPVQSTNTSQVHQEEPPASPQATSNDVPLSPQSHISPLAAISKGKTREDSISHSSLTLPHEKNQPIALPASASEDRPPSRSSMLTSPHSIAEKVGPSELAYSAKNRSLDMSPLTSPYSARPSPQDLSPPVGVPAEGALPAVPSNDFRNLFNEAGALYLVSDTDGDSSKQQPRRIQTTVPEQDDNSSSESDHHVAAANLSSPATSPTPTSVGPSSPKITGPVPVRQNTPMAFAEREGPINRQSPNTRSGSGRKPSGARELGTGRPYNSESLSSFTKPIAEENSDTDDSMGELQLPPQAKNARQLPSEDSNLDVLAALSYLDVDDEGLPPQAAANTVEPLKIRSPDKSAPSSSSLPESSIATFPAPASSEVKQATQFRSSFVPSKQAAERKAKVQAQQIAHNAAVHKPGRLNGKRKSRVGGAWNESSEEEDDDEDDEDEDEGDSDDEKPASNKAHTPPSGNASSNASIRPPQHQNQPGDTIAEPNNHQGLRGPRTLPQLPGGRPHEHPPQPRRMVSDHFLDGARRPPHDDVPQIRSQAEYPQLGSTQKSLWSQVLEPGRTPGQLPESHTTRDTFIQLEHPSETMTKAFTPQGLLSAGLQDKQDRSAKRQEELARETGASLINVPNKPPPPQTGLLGAITAHERERKREGGVGAALTERERERRMAEERQRRFDEQQRQQLEQLQQSGSMYLPGFNPMVNPMMMGMMGMNPMMTGMAPMMTGGMAPMMTGYPGMMPGLNPQQMFAAHQAAAQAYQQAMMAFSTAGSQVATGENGNGTQPMVPNMTGGMSFMGGYDPRMSMMGMGMMTPQMGMPLGMQMTGMSTLDPRFSANAGNGSGLMNEMGLQPPNVLGGQNLASRSSSPARRDSPATRPPEQQETPKGSRPTSPKP